MHTLHILHLYHTTVVKVVCQLATAGYRQFLYYIAIRWNRLYVQPAFFRFRSIVSSILRFWGTRHHLSNNFFRFPFHKILIFNLFPGNSTYFEFWNTMQSYVFFSSERKNVAYTFLHSSYTLTFKLLENSHTRTIHKTSRIIDIKLTIYREANDTRVWNKRRYIIILA